MNNYNECCIGTVRHLLALAQALRIAESGKTQGISPGSGEYEQYTQDLREALNGTLRALCSGGESRRKR